jgi:hypothetical protein
MAEFTSDIWHILGKENRAADALSHPATAVVPASMHVDFKLLAAEQCRCGDVLSLRDSAGVMAQQVPSGRWCRQRAAGWFFTHSTS